MSVDTPAPALAGCGAVTRTLVTGGTGFVGSAIVRALRERGDEVRVTVRASSPVGQLDGLDVETVACDILDGAAVRRALKGVDTVVHAAGMTSLRAPADAHLRLNVGGARAVLREALRSGAGRVVHVSSFAAVGPATRGSTTDERQHFRAGRHGIAYVSAMHEAEAEALRLAAAGLDVVIVNPGLCLGRGDVRRTSTEVVRRFLRAEIPAYVDGAVNVVDVDDVAAGVLLAQAHGKTGERYLLGNRNFTLDRLFADLGRLSGVEPPAVKLPLEAALALERSLPPLPGLPRVTETELRAMGEWWAYRSTKARRELGYRPRHHEESLRATIDWYREREGERLRPPGARQPLVLRGAGFALRRTGRLRASIMGS